MTTVQRSDDIRNNPTPDMLWDFLGICIDKDAMADVDAKINVRLTDQGQDVLVRVKNGPLLHFDGIQADDADITLAGPKLAMLLLMSHDVAHAKAALSFSGNEDLLVRIMDAMQPPTGISPFNIIEP